MKQYPTIGVAGAGAWGLALANAAASAGRSVAIWGRDAALMRALERDAARRRDYPASRWRRRFASSADLRALDDCDAILVAVPAQATREAAGRIVATLSRPRPLVACAKGIERGSERFMTEVLGEIGAGMAERDPLGAELSPSTSPRACRRR